MTAAIESLRSRSRASGAQSNDLCLHFGWRQEKMCVTQKACLLDCSFVCLSIIVASPLCPTAIHKTNKKTSLSNERNNSDDKSLVRRQTHVVTSTEQQGDNKASGWHQKSLKQVCLSRRGTGAKRIRLGVLDDMSCAPCV